MTSFTMKILSKPILLFLPILILFALHPFHRIVAKQVYVSPSPTYDPLVEPPLPENPTEFELGRNLYWHWCMTCHGDRGQGLTDEFRAIWEPEHQDCWESGCHAGRPGDGGFPIPTVVPALVDETHLAQFASVQELSNFLKATHPPQSPGILRSGEYHAIALFVLTMNGRPGIDIPSTTPIAKPTLTSVPSQDSIAKTTSEPVNAIISLMVLVALIFIFIRSRRVQEKNRRV